MKKTLNLVLLLIIAVWIIFAMLFPIINYQLHSLVLYIISLSYFALSVFYETKIDENAKMNMRVLLPFLLSLLTPMLHGMWTILQYYFQIWNFKQITDSWDSPYFEFYGSAVLGKIVFSFIIPYVIMIGIMILNKKEIKST